MFCQEVCKCHGAWNVCKLSSVQERDYVLPICYLVDSGNEKDAREGIWEVLKGTVSFSSNAILMLSHSLPNCAVLTFKFFPNFLPRNI